MFWGCDCKYWILFPLVLFLGVDLGGKLRCPQQINVSVEQNDALPKFSGLSASVLSVSHASEFNESVSRTHQLAVGTLPHVNNSSFVKRKTQLLRVCATLTVTATLRNWSLGVVANLSTTATCREAFLQLCYSKKEAVISAKTKCMCACSLKTISIAIIARTKFPFVSTKEPASVYWQK